MVGLLVVFLGDAGERFVVGFFVANNRAVCFDYDVALLAVVDNFMLLAPWVELEKNVSKTLRGT